jgi:hypothetical protein
MSPDEAVLSALATGEKNIAQLQAAISTVPGGTYPRGSGALVDLTSKVISRLLAADQIQVAGLRTEGGRQYRYYRLTGAA